MILAVAGKMGSGKDTVAKHLVENLGFVRMAFADNLKYACMNAFGLSYEDCFNEEAKFKPFGYDKEYFWFWEKFEKNPVIFNTRHAYSIINWAKEINNFPVTNTQVAEILAMVGRVNFETPRHILQYVGTEIFRNIIDEDYHAKVLANEIKQSGAQNIVISDCRFPNERIKVKSWGGTTILVTGRETSEPADLKSKAHASENSLGTEIDYDYVILNNGTLVNLYEAVDGIILDFNLLFVKEQTSIFI